MSSAALVIAGLGIIFIWAGVRGDDPRDLFADAFRGTKHTNRRTPAGGSGAGSAVGSSVFGAGAAIAKRALAKKTASYAPKGNG